MRRDGTRTGVPAVVMWWDASDVVPGVVTNKSLNLSTTVTKHVLIISGNSVITDVLYYATRMRMLVFKCCRIGF